MVVLLLMILGAIGYAMSLKKHVVRKNGQRLGRLPRVFENQLSRRTLGIWGAQRARPVSMKKLRTRYITLPPLFWRGSIVFGVRETNSAGPSADRGDGGADTLSGQPYHTRPGDAVQRFGNVARAAELAEESGGRKTAAGDLWGGWEAG